MIVFSFSLNDKGVSEKEALGNEIRLPSNMKIQVKCTYIKYRPIY